VTAPHGRKKYAREFGSNLRALVGWRRSADDVREELRIHEEMRAADGRPASRPGDREHIVAAGASLLDDADRRARRLQWLEEAGPDLRHGWRTMRDRPTSRGA
jgi:hypothetical protein